MTFRSTLLQGGKTATGICVPEEVVLSLGSRRPPVWATVNGHTYRSTVASMRGRYMLPVSAENRALAGIAAGDVVDVELRLDTEPRDVPVPADLAAALDAAPAARDRFASLSNSRKKYFVLPIEQAKAPETRARRIAKAVATLNAEAAA